MRNFSQESVRYTTEEDQMSTVQKKNQDAAIDYNQFDPIIRSVLRASNVYRYKGATHIKDEYHLHSAIEEIHSDANLTVKK